MAPYLFSQSCGFRSTFFCRIRILFFWGQDPEYEFLVGRIRIYFSLHPKKLAFGSDFSKGLSTYITSGSGYRFRAPDPLYPEYRIGIPGVDPLISRVLDPDSVNFYLDPQLFFFMKNRWTREYIALRANFAQWYFSCCDGRVIFLQSNSWRENFVF